MRAFVTCLLPCLLAFPVGGLAADGCNAGVVFEDTDRNGRRDPSEPGLAGIRVSDGRRLAVTGADGRYALPVEGGRTVFVVKPATHALPPRAADGLPDFWRHVQPAPGPALAFGGIPAGPVACRDFALLPAGDGIAGGEDSPSMEVLAFGDPQPKSLADVGHYRRDIVEPLLGRHRARLGLSLGDIVDDDLSLYPAMKAATARLGVPWLHVPGNHDLDFDAARDEDSLRSFRREFGPDTFAWEEPEATFVVLDDVVYRPGQSPAYVGGLREEQFAFLEAYLPAAPRDRLLVVAAHIPFFDAARAGAPPTFRPADRERLFGLLRDFPQVLLLSAHSHVQRQFLHGAASGWQGPEPLLEFNVGATCGAFWSGVEDAAGIPDATMADGTPNGHATLVVNRAGYRLAYHPARDPAGTAIGLHAPRVLRQGAWPGFAVYANVYMGRDDSRVDYRIDDGPWKPMAKVLQPDPRLLAENARDDAAPSLRGYDRSPEAAPSQHLWRGALPTDLAVGVHVVEVRFFDPWQGEQRARTRYRLERASP